MPASIRCPKCGSMQMCGPTCTACGASLDGMASPANPPLRQTTTPGTSCQPPEAPPRATEAQRPRLSRMALVSLVTPLLMGVAQFPALLFLGNAFGIFPDPDDRWIPVRNLQLGLFFFSALIWPVVTAVLGGVAAFRIKRSHGRLKGRGLALLGVLLGILMLLFNLIAIPNLFFSPNLGSKYGRAMYEAKTAVEQALRYGKDKGVYPTSLRALRESGYGDIRDKDPWDTDYVLSPNLTAGAVPSAIDDVYVYSRGRCRSGTYSPGISEDTGECAAGGWSSLHGAFSSWRKKRKD